jgi:hypothetical protein
MRLGDDLGSFSDALSDAPREGSLREVKGDGDGDDDGMLGRRTSSLS